MGISLRFGVVLLFALAAVGGARLGQALHGPLASELQATHWDGSSPLECNGDFAIEVRGENVHPAGVAVVARNGCHVTIEGGEIHGFLDLSNGGVTHIHDAHVDTIRLLNDSTLTVEGGSIDQLVVHNESTVHLDGVRVRRLGFTNHTQVTIRGGAVEDLVTFNDCTLVAEDAIVTTLDVYNQTNVTLRGGTCGLLYTWNGAHAALHGTRVGELDAEPRGLVEINDAHVAHSAESRWQSWNITHDTSWME